MTARSPEAVVISRSSVRPVQSSLLEASAAPGGRQCVGHRPQHGGEGLRPARARGAGRAAAGDRYLRYFRAAAGRAGCPLAVRDSLLRWVRRARGAGLSAEQIRMLVSVALDEEGSDADRVGGVA